MSEVEMVSKSSIARASYTSKNIGEIDKFLAGKAEEKTPEKVIENYKELIDKYNDDQKAEWALWKDNLPTRIVAVSKMQNQFVQNSKIIDAINYIFIAFSAILPIIITYLTTMEPKGLPDLAHALDLLFPALVGIVTTIKTGVESKRDALISVKSPYETLLANIIVDIAQKNYAKNKTVYQGDWGRLNAILASAKIEM